MSVTPEQSAEHPDRVRWNQKYTQEGLTSFGLEPAAWLRQHEPLLLSRARGAALDVAAGNGRNAFYLAQLGFAVDALDISDVAVHWVRQQARQRRLAVYCRRTDLATEPLPKAQYQLVVNVNYLQRTIFAALKETLVPGGLLVVETMTVDQIDLLGRQVDRQYLLEHNELKQAFDDLQILEYREAIISGRGDKKRAVASLLARKGHPAGHEGAAAANGSGP